MSETNEKEPEVNGADEHGSPPESVEEKTTEQQMQEYLEGWKRALADYENLKQGLSKERDHMRHALTESIVSGFLTIFDHFEQAIKFQPSLETCDEETAKQIQNWMTGVGYVRNAMLDQLKSYGVEVIEPELGSEPNAVEHETVGETDSGGKSGVIVEVSKKGWRIADKVIQPAQIIISK